MSLEGLPDSHIMFLNSTLECLVCQGLVVKVNILKVIKSTIGRLGLNGISLSSLVGGHLDHAQGNFEFPLDATDGKVEYLVAIVETK